MKQIIRIFYILLACLSPFGSANIFNLDQYSAQVDSSQGGFLPLVFGMCTIVSVLDRNVRTNFKYLKPIFIPLLGFIILLFFSELAFCGGSFNYVYFIKLIVAIVGFVVMSQTFITYPQILNNSLLVYAITSVCIVIAFFAGLLEQSYYYSNGRLWFLGINPNTYSFMIGFAIIILLFYINRKDSSIKYRLSALLCIFPLFIFLLLSGSRGSLLFLILSIIIIYYKHIIYIGLFGMIAISSLGIYISNTEYEITTLERFSDVGKSNERFGLIEKTLDVFEHSPILGVGPTGYHSMMLSKFNEERDSHNVIISNLAMGGIFGTILYLLFLFKLFISITKQSKYRVFALAVFIYMTLISLKTGNVLTYSLMWYIYSVALSLSLNGRDNANKFRSITFKNELL